MNIVLFEDLPENNVIPQSDVRARHIAEILKLKEGDSFRMGLINRSEGRATILSYSNEGIRIDYKHENQPVLYPVTLICAQVRPICMKRILREAVSLGCERIILTGSQTGEKSYLSSNLYRTGEYKEYLLDGAMQSAHAGIPEVLFAENVKETIKLVKTSIDISSTSCIIFDNVRGSEMVTSAEIKSSAVVAVGPERGWSDYERKMFEDAGFSPMLLGKRVLRTETACSAGLALILARMNYI